MKPEILVLPFLKRNLKGGWKNIGNEESKCLG
jgi:hypothetical protein